MRFSKKQSVIKNHVFFSPHFDDVILSCGGLVEKLQKAGGSVWIITVFAGQPEARDPGPFARHLHAKWWLPDQEVWSVRRDEDWNACQSLNVEARHWPFKEAIYRFDSEGCPLYCSYQSLNEKPIDGPVLHSDILNKVKSYLANDHDASVRLYFPLGLANHVDHQILVSVGSELVKAGCPVWFYEEWPYLEERQYPVDVPTGWERISEYINLEHKCTAINHYGSQIPGLGGSMEAIYKRLKKSAGKKGRRDQASESYWIPFGSDALQERPVFLQPSRQWRLRDFKKILSTLNNFANVWTILPRGSGAYLDVGCGKGPYQRVAEEKGYDWTGFDVCLLESPDAKVDYLADARHIPLSKSTQSAVMIWGVLSYVPDPEMIIHETWRLLKVGGLLIGMVAFLEPVHGRTYSGLSPLEIQSLLEKYGFEDISIKPGVNGFTLLLWTLLRRYGGDKAAKLAFPLTKLWLLPLAWLRFFFSWVKWRFGRGGGYGMAWVTEQMPLDFAGHIIFTARKGRSRPQEVS